MSGLSQAEVYQDISPDNTPILSSYDNHDRLPCMISCTPPTYCVQSPAPEQQQKIKQAL